MALRLQIKLTERTTVLRSQFSKQTKRAPKGALFTTPDNSGKTLELFTQDQDTGICVVLCFDFDTRTD